MANPALDIGIKTEADGSIVVDLTQRRKSSDKPAADSKNHDANLADGVLDAGALSAIEADLHQGIDADISSRQQWVDNYNAGLLLLGLLLEKPQQLGNNTSTCRHPLLSWAIVQFQAQASGEMLPARGPVKVDNSTSSMLPEIAEALERDMNHYFKAVAREYYPDTDRALYYIGYGGTVFKKVYTCPLRERPVSEFVALPDLIVSNEATTLRDARRVTHQIEGFSLNRIRQMQEAGWWADVPVSLPTLNPSSTRTAVSRAVGITSTPTLQQDYPYTISECYTWLDLGKYGEAEPKQPDGLELPYVVTFDRDTRQVYAVRRNWRANDPRRAARQRFVKWGMVPGIGYLDMGYLNLLGNLDMAATALLRVLIDAGIYSIFPGGVRKKGMRMETNQIRPAPGEFPEIDTGDLPIQAAIMPLPFKGPAAESLALLQHIETQADRIIGAVNIQTKEGVKDIPVGTMMAAIETSAQPQIAVHKRLHNAQKDEFQLLRDEFEEMGEAGLALLKQGDQEQPYTAEQLFSAALIPASDPEMPAHLHRFMQATALEALSAAHPDLYNQRNVQQRILEMARINGMDEILLPPPDPTAPPPPDPAMIQLEMLKQIEDAKLALKKEDQDGRRALEQLALQIKAMQSKEELALKREESERKASVEAANDAAQSDAERDEATLRAALEAEQADKDRAARTDDAAADRESREAIATMGDQTKLIIEDKRIDAEPTEADPLRDKKSGP